MKKIALFIGVMILLFSSNFFTHAKSNELIIENKKIWAMPNQSEIKAVEKGLLYINNDSIKYIYNSQEVCSIKEEYLAHTIDSNYLYLVTNNNQNIYLRSISISDKKENIISLNMNRCNQILIIDNELVLIGSSNSDACITKYNKKLNFLYEYKFGGSNYEEFVKTYYYNNKYYLIGKKDAHSKNSPFMDVGSVGEIKTFACIIDNKGIIEESVYFNFNETSELLYTSDFKNNELMVCIKLLDSYQTYILNTNLETLDIEESLETDDKILLSNTGNILYINEEEIKVNNEVFKIDIDSEILYLDIIDNVLKVYYYKDHYLWESSIYQYKIEKQEDIIVNIYNAEFNEKMNMNDLKELKISSYIHDLNLELDSIEPYFSKQIPGKYTGHFKIKINDQKSFKIDNYIKIEEYVNIYDNHIYPVGYKLKFFGYGLLDGKSIVSDTILKDAGVHNLLISDALGKTKKYTFQVVENYYFNQEEYTFSDYTIRKNDTIELNFKTNKLVENIYLNNQKVDFEQVNEDVKVILNDFQNQGIYIYNINKIEYFDEVKNIEKTFTVRVLKDEPIINITEEKNENFTLNIDFIDYDYSVRDLFFEVYYDDELQEILHSYLNDFEYKVGNIQKDKKITINGYICYDIGNGELKKVEVLKSSFYIDESVYELLHVKRVDNQIKLEVMTNNKSLTINELEVNNQSFSTKYQTTVNYQPLYISLVLSGIIIIIGGALIYYFKVFKKKRK